MQVCRRGHDGDWGYDDGWYSNVLNVDQGALLTICTPQQKKIFFVTNNATKSRVVNAAKLTALGIPATMVRKYGAACPSCVRCPVAPFC